MTRHAILVANSINYGGLKSFNVPRRVVYRLVNELGERLGNASPEPYRLTPVVDQPSAQAQRTIKKALRNASGADSMVLFFYFGHGIVGEDRKTLYLYFNDNEVDDLPSMLRFSDIVEWVDSYKVGSALFVVDCCYAGLGAEPMLAKCSRPCYLMASVNAKERAAIDYAEEVPLGVFTRWFLRGFTDQRARATLSRRVTAQSLFDFMNAETRAKSSQTPVRIDGGLAGHVLWEQTSAITIQKSVRSSVAKKGLYRKLFAIGTSLLATEFRTETAFHKFFDDRKSPEMLTPVLAERGVVRYRVVGFRAFQGYLRTARELGMVQKGEPVRLTPEGKRMCRVDGARFNLGLCDALKGLWSRGGVELTDLEDTLTGILRRGGVPSEDAAFWETFLSERLHLSRAAFYALLALSADVGLVQCSREKTFFPVAPEEPESVAAL